MNKWEVLRRLWDVIQDWEEAANAWAAVKQAVLKLIDNPHNVKLEI